MNGKTLKVVQYNLEFGASDRFVDVFGCFKYKPNSNMYLIYADTKKDQKYNMIYYGSSHVKGNSILSMRCREAKEVEIIKEYIFKVTNHETLDNFEVVSLENIEEIEIIASDKLEVKPEILSTLTEITLPKKQEDIIEKTPPLKKKKKNSKTLIFFLLILVMISYGAYYFLTLSPKDTTSKKIICQKEYQHKTLEAVVQEENTYNFNVQDNLERIDTIMTYQFEEEDYQDFIMKGTYYKYLPDEDQDGGFKQDDKNYTFKIMMKETIDTSYTKPTAYEEVLAYYKTEGYTCTEEFVRE